MCFEIFDAPAVYVAHGPAAALSAVGRRTGVVVDLGEGQTTVTPVFGGYALPHAIARHDVGGRDQTLALAKFLTERDGAGLQPAATLHDEARLRSAKERVMRTAATQDEFDERERRGDAGDAETDAVSFMHQGRELRVNFERWRVGEVAFNPALLGIEAPGVAESVHASLLKCDVDIREELLSAVVMVGGGAAAAGLAERLRHELQALGPSTFLVQVIVPDEPADVAWYGGTVMAATEDFDSMWIQRDEYDADGRGVVHRKCF